MGKRKAIGIRDVARESRASSTTVSLVLNRRHSRISEAMRRRVMRTAERLGYRPNRLAQALQAHRTGLIAVLAPRARNVLADAQLGELIGAIQETAVTRFGYKLLIELADEKYVSSGQHLELFERRYVDGILCVGLALRDRLVRSVTGDSPPVLVVNNYRPSVRMNYVRSDDQQAGRLAGDLLVGLGHGEIALLFGAAELQSTADLRAGFQRALGDGGVPFRRQRACGGLITEEEAAEAAMGLMSRDPAITAIVVVGDRPSIGVIGGLTQMRVDVPRDVSVVACHCTRQAEFLGPPLTTVCAPIREIGRRACERLMDLVDGRAASVEEIFPVSLKAGQSTAPPRRERHR